MSAVLVDWSAALSRLRARSGQSLAAHARVIGMDARTITRLARGDVVAPRWDKGCLLLDLCADHFTPEDWRAVVVWP